jgi:hypothetical protein
VCTFSLSVGTFSEDRACLYENGGFLIVIVQTVLGFERKPFWTIEMHTVLSTDGGRQVSLRLSAELLSYCPCIVKHRCASQIPKNFDCPKMSLSLVSSQISLTHWT